MKKINIHGKEMNELVEKRKSSFIKRIKVYIYIL